jgi:hypothetical protein
MHKKVTLKTLHNNYIVFKILYRPNSLSFGCVPSFELFSDILDPDPGGHRKRIQCGSGSGSATLQLITTIFWSKNLLV